MKKSISTAINLIKNYRWDSIFFKYWKKLFSMTILFFIIICSGIFYYFFSSTTSKIDTTVNQSMSKTKNTLNTIFSEIEKSYYLFSTNQNVIPFATSNNITLTGYTTNLYTSRINELMNNFINTSSYMDSIHIYNVYNNYVLSSKYSGNINTFYKKELFKPFIEKGKTSYIISPDKPNSTMTICFELNINGSTAGIVAFSIDTLKLENLLNCDEDKSNEQFLLLNKNKDIVFKSENYVADKEYMQKYILKAAQTKDDFVKTRNYIISYSPLLYGDISLIYINNNALYSNYRNSAIILIISMVIISILFPLIISFYLSMQFYGSIAEIASQFQVNDGDFQTSDLNELSYINMNIMSVLKSQKNIEHELIEKIASLKKAQSIALQTQINPHFLFNTLNLSSMIITNIAGGENDAEKIISLLSDLICSSLDTKNMLIPIKVEVNNLSKYIEIEKIKYKNNFDVVWDIDNSCLNFKTIQLILQPITENALEHGIRLLSDKRGKIQISLEKNSKDIIFKIKDNGTNLTEDKLVEIKNNLLLNDIPETRHIGLTNVNQRIKLIFGNKYGCDISHDDTGTTVTIIMPIVNE